MRGFSGLGTGDLAARPASASTGAGMRNTFGQIRAFLAANPYTAVATQRLSGRARAAIFMYRLSLRILFQWAHDKCPQQAAALAFTSALSLVPVTAIAFSILRALGSLDAQSQLLHFVAEHVFPQMQDVTERISDFSTKVSIGALGGAGLLFTLVTCYSLYRDVERIFNDIWRVGQRRTLIGKFLTFYAMLTLLPAVAGASLYWSGRLVESSAAWRFLAPAFIQLAGLVFMNKLLPRTNVTWTSAIIGGVFTAFALEGLKVAFVKFAGQIMLKSYSGVYGPLGLVPLVLVWIYSSWLLVLLGAEIAHSIQNLRLLEAEDRRRAGDAPINGLIAAQLLAAIAAAHERAGVGYPKEKLATEFGLTPDTVEQIIGRLKTRGLVAEVHGDLQGYIPGKAAQAISLDDVLGVFRASDIEIAHGVTSPELLTLVTELEETRQRRIAGVTIASLMPARPSTEPLPGVPEEPKS
jgi:membrane protein